MAGLSTNKDLNALAKRARKQGWTITLHKKSGHLEWRAPNGGVVFTASTPSDFRAIKNTLNRLCKLGYKK